MTKPPFERITVNEEQPVISLDQVEQQDTIFFHDYPVIAVRLVDGRIGAALRDMCKATGLHRYSQVRRIQEDITIADSLISVQIRTRGGPQVVDILVAWAIPYWLATVDLSRVTAEKQEAIAVFKKEAANALYAHFSQRKALPESTRPVVPAEPVQPAPDAPALEWAEYHRQMAALYEWKASIESRMLSLEEWQGEVEEQLYSHKQILAFVPEILERLGEEKITPKQQATIREKAKILHELTDAAYPTIYYYLGQAFGVTKIEDIPEIYWQDVEQWFTRRIETARKHKRGK